MHELNHFKVIRINFSTRKDIDCSCMLCESTESFETASVSSLSVLFSLDICTSLFLCDVVITSGFIEFELSRISVVVISILYSF